MNDTFSPLAQLYISSSRIDDEAASSRASAPAPTEDQLDALNQEIFGAPLSPLTTNLQT